MRRFAINLDALRASRDFRLLALGQVVSGLGTQAALVAVPYQVFVLTHSAGLVGLLGAAELGPMIVVSLLGGAIADRIDRRRLLLAAQLVTILAAGGLAALDAIDRAGGDVLAVRCQPRPTRFAVQLVATLVGWPARPARPAQAARPSSGADR